MKSLLVLAVVAGVFVIAETQRLQGRRRTTTTTTTESPIQISEREANLLAREEGLDKREKNFREREVNLTLREESIRLREESLAIREENFLKKANAAKEPVPAPPPDFTLVRYDKTSGKLVDIGSTGSCPENMRFFALPGSKTEGVCDCDYHQCDRPLLYSAKYDQCFWAWSQGPCEQGEWYTYNDTLHPVCQKTTCPKSLALRTNRYYFQDPDDNECYETTTQGYCQEGEVLLTTADDPFPKCRTHALCFPLSIPAHQECIAGNKRHLDGLCEDSKVEA